MSLLNTIRVKLGLSNTPANNFVLTAEADNGTMKLARGNPGATTQDILTVDAAGKVGFSVGILGFVYGSNSNGYYFKTPTWLGNRLIQWGTYVAVGDVNGDTRDLYPLVFTSLPIVYCSNGDASAAPYITLGVRLDGMLPLESITVRARLSTTGVAHQSPHRVNWLAIGS